MATLSGIPWFEYLYHFCKRVCIIAENALHGKWHYSLDLFLFPCISLWTCECIMHAKKYKSWHVMHRDVLVWGLKWCLWSRIRPRWKCFFAHRLCLKKKGLLSSLFGLLRVLGLLQQTGLCFFCCCFKPCCSWVTSCFEGFRCQTVLHPACVRVTFLAAFPQTQRKSAESLHLPWE